MYGNERSQLQNDVVKYGFKRFETPILIVVVFVIFHGLRHNFCISLVHAAFISHITGEFTRFILVD